MVGNPKERWWYTRGVARLIIISNIVPSTHSEYMVKILLLFNLLICDYCVGYLSGKYAQILTASSLILTLSHVLNLRELINMSYTYTVCDKNYQSSKLREQNRQIANSLSFDIRSRLVWCNNIIGTKDALAWSCAYSFWGSYKPILNSICNIFHKL